MPSDDERQYALGTHDAEVVRLGMQNRLWSGPAFAIWERAGFRAGQTILDVGCGPGYTSFDLAGIAGARGRVIAVDESARFIEHLRRRDPVEGMAPIDARVGDAQRLHLDPSSIDAAYQRWVLCFVRNPEAVVEGVARALKPGGVFAIQDYMHYEGIVLAPRSEAFQRFITVVAEAWREHGGDTDIGQKLPALLAKHGMKPVEIAPLHRVARPHSQLWTWPTIFIETYGAKLLAEGRLTPSEHAALVTDWAARSNDPSAYFCSPPMVDIIAVKP